MNQQKSISSGLNNKILGLPKILFYGFIIVMLIIIFGSIIYAIYQKYFNKSPSPTTQPPTTLAPTTQPPTTQPPTTLAPTIPPGTGRYIKLYNPKVGCMDFTEIKVYSTDPNKNIADTAIVNASSKLDATLYPNSNWVDGNIDTFGHTLCTDAPWVEFDFGKDIQITKIILHPRLGWKGRTRGIILTIKDNNGNIIYTANPITSKTGEVEHSEQRGLDGYNYYTYNIPNTQWVGS